MVTEIYDLRLTKEEFKDDMNDKMSENHKRVENMACMLVRQRVF